MASLKASRSAQYVKSADFTFNFNDRMVPVSGGTAISGTKEVDFGETNIAATAFDIINIPEGAIIVGGELVVETAFDTASYAVIIGDADVTNRYLTTADRKAAAVTALVPTGYRTTGQNIRMTITNADVCTAGKAKVRVEYILQNCANEVVPN